MAVNTARTTVSRLGGRTRPEADVWSHQLLALKRTLADFGRLDTMLSALVRGRGAVWLVEKLTDRQIDQIGPTIECSMLARRHND